MVVLLKLHCGKCRLSGGRSQKRPALRETTVCRDSVCLRLLNTKNVMGYILDYNTLYYTLSLSWSIFLKIPRAIY